MNAAIAGKRVTAVGGGTGLPSVLRGLKGLVGPEGVDRLPGVVTNSRSASIEQLDVYAGQRARPVLASAADLAGHGVRVLDRDLLVEDDLIRHDPPAIRRVVEEILPHPVVAA